MKNKFRDWKRNIFVWPGPFLGNGHTRERTHGTHAMKSLMWTRKSGCLSETRRYLAREPFVRFLSPPRLPTWKLRKQIWPLQFAPTYLKKKASGSSRWSDGVGKNGHWRWKEWQTSLERRAEKSARSHSLCFFAHMKEASSFCLLSHPPCSHQSPETEKAKFTIFSTDCRFVFPVG